jgi:hypothetical protein
MTEVRQKRRVLESPKDDHRDALAPDTVGIGGKIDPRLRPFIDAMADLLLKDLLRKKT